MSRWMGAGAAGLKQSTDHSDTFLETIGADILDGAGRRVWVDLGGREVPVWVHAQGEQRVNACRSASCGERGA